MDATHLSLFYHKFLLIAGDYNNFELQRKNENFYNLDR